MTLKPGIVSFDWDEGNLDKSRRKHGVTPEEAESVFSDEEGFVLPDERHSDQEERQVLFGKSDRQRHLFVVFTIRDSTVRIISARGMHRKEIVKYETIKKDTDV
ncbi:BrnT family toxin [Candidatus Gottesmanbacteria bacterium]|nr:BrnT family toxin [Candidatus Gottesmanbacteria bacterium]